MMDGDWIFVQFLYNELWNFLLSDAEQWMSPEQQEKIDQKMAKCEGEMHQKKV